ncbi:CynX/NimT family MFS transporter [Pseudogracilibacillus auburnensis]|uniref:CynX/NimT family MFS transporter n=1 Tax=Pseudogracilibacillus auburnensis TaxID=1494959 RepID=UPI001F60BAF8|nr:MFS transporter [Pseudogracilibacillus auburnensis]
MKNSHHQIILTIGIIFVAFNLRPAITSVGPLIDSIRTDMGLSNSSAGFITTLPLLAFAILSPLAPKLGRRFGNEKAVLLGLVLLAMGVFIRSMDWVTTLFIGTGLAGLGIAFCNVILPGIVKEYFPEKAGMMTGVYTTAMSISAALASGLSIPLAVQLKLGWEKSLLIWGIFAAISVFIWLPNVPRRKKVKDANDMTLSLPSLYKSKLAWYVTFFIGLQSFIFYSTIAWIPEMIVSHGMDPATGGWMLAIMQFVGMPASFLTPILAVKYADQKGIVKVFAVFYLVGFIGLIFGSNQAIIILSVILIGIAQGGGFSLALTFFVLRSVHSIQAAALSGMAQSFGYLLAAVGPMLMGFLFDLTHNWTYPLIVLIGISIAMTIAGLGAGQNKLIGDKLTN